MSSNAFGEAIGLDRAPMEPRAGMRLTYEAYSVEALYRPAIREDFSVTLREIWPGGMTFQYAIETAQLGKQTGTEILTSLDDCAALDPWWDPSEVGHDATCQLRIPASVYWALKSDGRAWLNVDTVARGDTQVRWEVVGKTLYPCRIDGRTVLLNALEIRTTRGDAILVLDAPQMPWVLSIQSAWFSWRLYEVQGNF